MLVGIQLAIMGPSLAAAPILLAGSEEQKKKYLGSLAAEPIIAVSLFLLKQLKCFRTSAVSWHF